MNPYMMPLPTVASRINPHAWDAWLARGPYSTNIEDERSPQQIEMSNYYTRKAKKPKKPLVQFPPYEEPSKRGPR
jgi:hypothetical protein